MTTMTQVLQLRLGTPADDLGLEPWQHFTLRLYARGLDILFKSTGDAAGREASLQAFQKHLHSETGMLGAVISSTLSSLPLRVSWCC